MPDYVTTFEISDRKKSGGRLGSELLEVVKGLIEEELRESAEGDMVGDTAYAEISARDLEVNKQGDRMSVDVRVCTQGKGVFVDIRSLLFAKPPYKMPRPPALLERLTEEFRCMVGKEELSYEPLVVGESNAESYVTGDLTAEDRRLPILAVSEYFTGGYAINPMDAQKTLAGVARVVCYTKEANKQLGSMLNSRVNCFNGAVRVLWPGCRHDVNGDGPKSIFRFPTDAKREEADLLLDLREVCVWVAMASGFEEQFSKAKIRVFQDRIRLSQESGETIDKLNQHISDLNNRISVVETERDEHKETAGKKSKEVESLEADLDASECKIDELNRDLEASREEIKGLRELEKLANMPEQVESLSKENTVLIEKNNGLEKTIEDLHRELNVMVFSPGSDGDSNSISLTNSQVDNVTILNHAINIFRDLMRSHLVERLRLKDLKNMQKESAKPDVLNVHERETFLNILDLTRKDNRDGRIETFRFSDVAGIYLDFEHYQFLQDIQDARNDGAHPPYGGLFAEDVVSKLDSIANALDRIGESEDAEKVRRLTGLVRDG